MQVEFWIWKLKITLILRTNLDLSENLQLSEKYKTIDYNEYAAEINMGLVLSFVEH